MSQNHCMTVYTHKDRTEPIDENTMQEHSSVKLSEDGTLLEKLNSILSFVALVKYLCHL